MVLAQAPEEVHGIPGHQLAILERIGVPIRTGKGIDSDAEVIVDALIGYSLQGAPTGAVAELISSANGTGLPIVALDLPSGLSGDHGPLAEPIIRAATTLTLALPKVGLLKPASKEYVGRLYLADISVPALVYERMAISAGSLFSKSDIVALT